ncbi:hypothetical protein GU243_19570 [Pseudarthrobacter psychrotolerans]|uniref:Integral membrane protein n=1 Tax=Pseudarthrobacter psychrotolerans TaxID=2697569 RepID=A0A6P1NPB5_9MICC|nr:hypothetical protein [Pseudarthrobacter psychrotolerans]QHK21529.1 hypothetical protein GU243_19570 [Pseudarthrobacter psychrotolerans]
MDALIEIPGDRTAAKFAYAAAGIGVVGVATLGAMFAIEVPKNGPYVFGTINDATGGVFQLVIIPVILQVHRRLRRTPGSEAAKWLVIAASGAGSASSFLLVAKKLDFNVSTGISVGAMAVQAGWFLLAHRALLKTGGYPRDLAKLGQFIGGALVVALPLAALTALEPAPAWIRWGIGGAGLAVGAAAWVAWPYWYFLAGRHLSHVPREVRGRVLQPRRRNIGAGY